MDGWMMDGWKDDQGSDCWVQQKLALGQGSGVYFAIFSWVVPDRSLDGTYLANWVHATTTE